MNRHLVSLTSLSLCLACASSDTDGKKPTATAANVTADGGAVAKANAKAAIASAVMITDCPHQDKNDEPAKPAAKSPAADKPAAAERAPDIPADEDIAAGAALKGDSIDGGFDDCEQSTMQVTFTPTGDAPARVKVLATRLLRSDGGAEVATLKTRRPKSWSDDNRYRLWDEVVPAGTELKASYKLSVPDWGPVDKALGKNSVGHMFVLEVDFEIDGVKQTVKSPEFPRQEAYQIAT